jgi:O-antigen/teichoic acid export membrane protein
LIKNKIDSFLKSDLQVKITKGVLWSFLGTFISRGFLFLTTIFITNIVSVSDFGQIGLIKSVIVTFSLFSLASFGVTATRYVSLYKESDKKKTSRILSLTYFSTLSISLLFLLLIVLFTKTFAIEILNNGSLISESLIIAVAIFFSALNGYQNGALAGFEKFKAISIVNIVQGVLAIPILYFFTAFYGVLGYCIGMALLFIVLFFSSLFFLSKAKKEYSIKIDYKNISKEVEIIREFSVPSFLSGFIINPTILVCNNILVKSENGFASMGVYEAAFNFSIIAMTFNAMFGQVLYPFAIKLFTQKNKKFEFLNIYSPWLIGVFIGLFLIYLPDLFSMLFEDKYQNESMYKTVVQIAIFIIFISQRQGISRNLAAANRMWYGFFDNLIWSILAIFFTYYLVDFGAPGRAMAFVFAYLINTLLVLPFYSSKGIFPKDFIFSFESLLVWGIVGFSYISTLFSFSLSIRFLLLIFTLILLTIVSFYWFTKQKKVSCHE